VREHESGAGVGARSAQSAKHGAAFAGYCEKEPGPIVKSVVPWEGSAKSQLFGGAEGIAGRRETWYCGGAFVALWFVFHAYDEWLPG